LALIPCAHDTSATHVPSSNVSSTIPRFSSTSAAAVSGCSGRTRPRYDLVSLLAWKCPFLRHVDTFNRAHTARVPSPHTLVETVKAGLGRTLNAVYADSWQRPYLSAGWSAKHGTLAHDLRRLEVWTA
jgi:hypothetical protein